MALVAAAFLPTGSAGASRVRTVRLRALIASGSLTYTWSGDPARGCAAVGVCGIRGELILRPQPSGQSVSPNGPMNVFLESSGVSRVIRGEGGAVLGQCTDVPGDLFGSILFNLPKHRATTASVLPAPSSGRCAGPTSADLMHVSIPVRRTGRFSFDLSGTRSFTAGPFSGALVSTVRLVPAPGSSGGETFGSSSSGPGRPGQPAKAPTLEVVQLQYRVSQASSTIQTQFSGAGQPTCQIVDTCGASGSLAFSVAPSRGFTLIGTRLVHRQLSRRQMLNDVRRGRFRLNAFALLTGHISEVFNWPGGPSCSDAVAAPSLLLSTGPPPAPPAAKQTIAVTVSSNGGGPGTNVFRTHCPGPDDEDLFGASPDGGNETYAHGSITTAQLLARRSVLTLYEAGTFSGLAYTGSRSGTIALDLTLTKVTTEMQR